MLCDELGGACGAGIRNSRDESICRHISLVSDYFLVYNDWERLDKEKIPIFGAKQRYIVYVYVFEI